MRRASHSLVVEWYAFPMSMSKAVRPRSLHCQVLHRTALRSSSPDIGSILSSKFSGCGALSNRISDLAMVPIRISDGLCKKYLETTWLSVFLLEVSGIFFQRVTLLNSLQVFHEPSNSQHRTKNKFDNNWFRSDQTPMELIGHIFFIHWKFLLRNQNHCCPGKRTRVYIIWYTNYHVQVGSYLVLISVSYLNFYLNPR